MKVQVVGMAALLTLTLSHAEAQTLGNSSANDGEELFTTLGDSEVAGVEMPPNTQLQETKDDSLDSPSASSMPNSVPTSDTVSSSMPDANHLGSNQTSSASKTSSTDDVSPAVSTTDVSDVATKKHDDGSTADSSASHESSKTSDAACIVYTAGVSLVAVTVAAIL